MTTNDPVADESSDTTDAEPETKTLYIRENGALVPYGQVSVAATDGGTAVEGADDATDAERGVQTAYRATCHDCSWTRTRTDVIEADDLGGEHYRETSHMTEVIEVETAANPARSEPADFGGGSSTGVDDL